MESGKSVRISSKFLVANQQILTCKKCEKRVYEMEKFVADKDVYHKSCFRCTHCNRILSLNNYTASGANKMPYCKPHFIQLFKKKGNYEEGFGAEKVTSGRYDTFEGFKPSGANTKTASPDSWIRPPSVTSPVTKDPTPLTGDMPEAGTTKNLLARFQNMSTTPSKPSDNAAPKMPSPKPVRVEEPPCPTNGHMTERDQGACEPTTISQDEDRMPSNSHDDEDHMPSNNHEDDNGDEDVQDYGRDEEVVRHYSEKEEEQCGQQDDQQCPQVEEQDLMGHEETEQADDADDYQQNTYRQEETHEAETYREDDNAYQEDRGKSESNAAGERVSHADDDGFCDNSNHGDVKPGDNGEDDDGQIRRESQHDKNDVDSDSNEQGQERL